MRKTKIVATIGPASESAETVASLIQAGMNVARLNLSHGKREELCRRIETVRVQAEKAGVPVAILLDTRGPEIRIKTFLRGPVTLVRGQEFTLTTREVRGDQTRVSVTYSGLPGDVEVGSEVLLDDGNIILRVKEIRPPDVVCQVVDGGLLSDWKKVSLPGAGLGLPVLTENDRDDVRLGVEMGVDFIAVSFVRKPEDVLEVRRLVEEWGGDQHLIAKVETRECVGNLEGILKVSDGLMVARGDLGVEFPVEEVPVLQKEMIHRCNELGKPVITATQMLESMIHNPRPTRAEASDAANAIFDGTDAVMLSAETAVGEYPVEAVRTMARIASRAEQALDYEKMLANRKPGPASSVTDAISHATCTTAQDLKVEAVVTATQSGHTARMVSKYRPQAPIIAVTPKPEVARRLCLSWGVFPLTVQPSDNTDETIERAVETALDAGMVHEGALVVITAGVPVGVTGTTNLIKVHTVGQVMVRGTGIGHRSATGRVCVVASAAEALEKVETGDILVASTTNPDYMPAIKRAAALVVEEGGLTSHAATTGLSLNLPVVVGAARATEILRSGMVVTIDGTRGLVYRGKARVL